MPKNQETTYTLGTVQVDQARRLMDAARAHDTGTPREYHLPSVPYDEITLRGTALRGLSHAVERVDDFDLDPKDKLDQPILAFVESFTASQQPPVEPPAPEVFGLAIRPPEKLRRAKARAGQIATALAFGGLKV